MLKRTLIILGAMFLALSMWIWIQKIAIPHQQAESTALGSPRGNLSDLYPRWLGARELLLHHRDPYGEDITREIQIGYYGRVLDHSRANDPKDQQAFAYPVYVALLLAPTVEMPFPIVQRIAFWLFAALTAASVLLWLHALGWRISATAMTVWFLLTLSSFPAIQGIKLQQLSLLVSALLAAFMYALARRHFVWAGILLAVATIKPQLVALPILWLCIWTVGNWRVRQRVLWSFGITVAALAVAGELLLPGWINEFRTALAAYYQYTGGGNSVLDVALTPIWGRVAAVLLVCVLGFVTWNLRRADERTAEFQWSVSMTLAVTLAVIPMFAPYNQLLLLPGIMLIIRSIRGLWARGTLSRFMVVITMLAIFYQWIAAAALVIASVFLPAVTVQRAWGLPFYLSFALPIMIPALLLVARGALHDAHPQPASI